MNNRAKRNPAPRCTVVVAVALVTLTGCRILGLSPVPCRVDSHCPRGTDCDVVAKVCVVAKDNGPVPPVFLEALGPVRTDIEDHCGTESPREPGTSERIGVAPTRDAGVAALSTRLLGENAVAVIDATACVANGCANAIAADFTATPAPVAVLGQAAMRVTGPALSVSAPFSPASTFTFELIARAPTSAGVIAEQTGVWRVFLDTSALGRPALFVGVGDATSALLLDVDAIGRWFHLLCVLTPGLQSSAAADTISCAFDGGAPQAPADSTLVGTLPNSATVTLLPNGSDAAVATFRAWQNVTLAGDATARQDRLSALAALRLATYTGAAAQGEHLAFLGSTLDAPQTLLLPAIDGLSDSTLVVVGPRWPRVVLSADAPTLLLEPARTDLAQGALRRCVGDVVVSEPVGVLTPGCSTANLSTTVSLTEQSVARGVVFSALVFGSTASLVVHGSVVLDGATVARSCRFDTLPPTCELGLTATVVTLADDVAQVSIALPALPQTTVQVEFAGGADDALWGAQLEAGRYPSSPLLPPTGSTALPTATTVTATALSRGADVLVWNLPPTSGGFFGIEGSVTVRTPSGPVDYEASALHWFNDLSSSQNTLGIGFKLSDALVMQPTAIGAGPTAAVADRLASFGGAVPVGSAVAFTTEFTSSNDPQLSCIDLQACSLVRLPATGAGWTIGKLQAGHVGMFSVTEPMAVQHARVQVQTSFGTPAEFSLAVEPRAAGCADRLEPFTELARYEACATAALVAECGDVSTWRLNTTQTAAAPLPGRVARKGGGTTLLSAPIADRRVIVSARFLTPPATAPDTTIVSVLGDADDVGFLSALNIAQIDGRLTVAGPSGGRTVLNVDADTWVQLTCALPNDGAGAGACLVNLDPTRVPISGERGHGVLTSITVGPDVFVDRVSVRASAAGLSPSRVVAAAQRNLAASFGLFSPERRNDAVITELRTTPAYQNNDGVLSLVGAGWPRFAVTHALPAYLSESASQQDLLADDFSSFGVLSASVSPGPAAASTAYEAQDVTLVGPDLPIVGCVSVYAQVTSKNGAVELGAAGLVEVAKASRGGRRLKNGYTRLKVCVSGEQRLGAPTLKVTGSARLALPQVDSFALTEPMVGDARGVEALRIEGEDLGQGAFGFGLRLQGELRGQGVFLQFVEDAGADGSAADATQLLRVWSTVVGSSTPRLAFEQSRGLANGTPTGDPTPFSPLALTPGAALTFNVRDTAVYAISNGAADGAARTRAGLNTRAIELGGRAVAGATAAALRLTDVTIATGPAP